MAESGGAAEDDDGGESGAGTTDCATSAAGLVISTTGSEVCNPIGAIPVSAIGVVPLDRNMAMASSKEAKSLDRDVPFRCRIQLLLFAAVVPERKASSAKLRASLEALRSNTITGICICRCEPRIVVLDERRSASFVEEVLWRLGTVDGV